MKEHAAHALPLLVTAVPASTVAWRAVRRTTSGRAAQLVTAAALLAAGAVHAGAAQHHLGTQRGFFVLVAAGQAALAVVVLGQPQRRSTVDLVVLTSVGLLTLWLESRTVGLAYGVEPLGPSDLLAAALELTAAVGARWLTGPGSRPTRVDGELAAWGLIVVAGALAVSA